MVWKAGQSGNPDGRPLGSFSRVPTDKEMKDSFKKNCPEALNNVIEYMRGNASLSRAHQERINAILADMASAEPEDQKDLARSLTVALGAKDTSDDRVLKASVKLIDVTYNITVNDDKLKIARRKIRAIGKNGSQEDDSLEDGDDYKAPIMSLKSV